MRHQNRIAHQVGSFVSRIIRFGRVTVPGLLFFVLGSTNLKAQTTLAQGDIAFVAYNSDGTVDDFAFMLLKDITAGTSITFTDHLWMFGASGGFDEAYLGACNTEAFITWTSGSSMSVGAIVVISSPGPAGFGAASEATASTGSLTVQGSCPDFTFPPTGDVLFAYQGTKPANNSASNWLACINMDGGWLSASSTSTSASALPGNLSSDNIILFSPEVDNAVYKGTLTGTATQLKTSIYNLANWNSSDAATYTLPQDIGSSTLPLVWGDFNVQSVMNGIELKWSTLTELNTAHFEVEYSHDGIQYTSLGQVTASGNSSVTQYYRLFLSNSQISSSSAQHYFRLKQVDQDGRFSFSSVIRWRNQTLPQLASAIVADPVARRITLQLSKTGCLIQIYDLQGKLLYESRAGAASTSVILPDQSRGILIIRLTDEKAHTEVHKLRF